MYLYLVSKQMPSKCEIAAQSFTSSFITQHVGWDVSSCALLPTFPAGYCLQWDSRACCSMSKWYSSFMVCLHRLVTAMARTGVGQNFDHVKLKAGRLDAVSALVYGRRHVLSPLLFLPTKQCCMVWLPASPLTDWSDRGCLISLWKHVYLKVRVSGGVNTDAVSDIRSTESPSSRHLCFPIR